MIRLESRGFIVLGRNAVWPVSRPGTPVTKGRYFPANLSVTITRVMFQALGNIPMDALSQAKRIVLPMTAHAFLAAIGQDGCWTSDIGQCFVGASAS